MTQSPTPEDELTAEFSAVGRRLSRAIREGHAGARRRGRDRTTTRDVLSTIPARNRDSLVAVTRWAHADAHRESHPTAAQAVDTEMRARGYNLTGPSSGYFPHRDELPHPGADLNRLVNERNSARADARQLPGDVADLRSELAAERESGTSNIVAAGVLAGTALLDAVDDELDVAQEPGGDFLATATDAAVTMQADSGADRTASVDDLLSWVNVHDPDEMLRHTLSQTDQGAADVGRPSDLEQSVGAEAGLEV